MPRNATGNYSLPEAPFVAGTVISSAAVNDDLNDIGLALTGSLSRSGQGGMIGQFKAIDGSVANPAIAFNNDLLTGICRPADHSMAIVIDGVVSATFTPTGMTGVSTGLVPVSAILDLPISTIPTNWLLCYGQAISRTTYATLFGFIGVIYGSGDGTTTFNVPDLRGRTIFGSDAMGGVAASRLTTAFFGSDPTVIGNGGGVQSRVLGTGNLPAYTPTGTITPSSSLLPATNISSGPITLGNGGATVTHTWVTADGGGTGTPIPSIPFVGSAQGGSSVAFSLINPSMIMNKIIYAGI